MGMELYGNLRKRCKETQEEFKDVIRSCRKKSNGVKAQLELNQATSMKGNKKSFSK